MSRGRNKKASGRRVHMYFTPETYQQACDLADAWGTSLTTAVTIATRMAYREEFRRAPARDQRSNGASNAQVHR